MIVRPLALLALLALAAVPAPSAGQSTRGAAPIVVDDFQGDRAGALPGRWRFFSSKSRSYEPLAGYMGEDERFYVVQEGANRFLRGYTRDEAQRISIPADAWNVSTHPALAWRWRAVRLPEGAREDDRNDSGGAVLVTFDKTDWLGRPFSIKYTYSTLLPVGTTVSFGNLKVLVVSSGVDGTGAWRSVRRDVAADYRRLFDRDDVPQPASITLWSDSDDTGSIGEVDFDDIVFTQ